MSNSCPTSRLNVHKDHPENLISKLIFGDLLNYSKLNFVNNNRIELPIKATIQS